MKKHDLWPTHMYALKQKNLSLQGAFHLFIAYISLFHISILYIYTDYIKLICIRRFPSCNISRDVYNDYGLLMFCNSSMFHMGLFYIQMVISKQMFISKMNNNSV